MNITMTGVPIVDCSECGFRHPVTRKHCAGCGLATIFGHDACRSLNDEAEL
jgi:predicted RNA-binding Zn-ribbon protein involved in translation (DUF1610 family)